MTTAYTSLLGLALPVTGELSGTWGDTVNTAITSLLDTAVAGTTSITTDADITLSTTTGASNEARQAIILWNPASGTTTRNITAPAQSKMYTVINASGGTQSIVIRGAGPTTGVTVLKGEAALVAWNGSDFVKVSSIGGAGTFTNLTVTGNTILGDAIGDTLTVNATTSFTAPVNLPSTGRSAAAAITPTAPAFLYGVASTYTDTASSGTLAPVGAFYALSQPTLSTSNVTTYTNAATLYLANAPAAGGSATITNSYAMYVAAGASYFGGNLTFNGGTADGVLYLNGNKVVTSGSSLVFDGTNLGVGASSAGAKLSVNKGASGAILRLTDGSQQSMDISSNVGVSSSGTITSDTVNGGAQAWAIATSEKMRLTSTGLGIGTTTPAVKLQVVSDTPIRMNNAAASSQADLYFADSGATFRIENFFGTGSVIAFGTNANGAGTSERMRITSAGYVGVNTASPNNLVTIQGDATGASFADNAVAQLVIRGATSTAKRLGLGFDTTNNFGVIQAQNYGTGAYPLALNPVGGNVGVGTGTSSPAYQLAVKGSTGIGVGTSGNAGMSLTFSGAIGGDSINEAAVISATYTAFGATSAGALLFTTNSGSSLSEKARITAAGNFGIGTSSPTVKLDVEGGQIRVNTTDNTSNIYLTNSGTTYLQLRGNTTSALINNPTSGPMVFGTSDTERMRITAAGNVGIGTTTPTQKLVVYEANTTAYSIVETGAAGAYAIFLAKNPNNDLYLWNRGDNNTSLLVSTAWDMQIATNAAKYISFLTNSSEAGRFTSGGDFCVGTTSSNSSLVRIAKGSQGQALYVSQDAATNITTAQILQTVSGGNNNQPIGLMVQIEAQGTGDRIYSGYYYNGGSPQEKFFVQRDGTVANATGTYGTISDIRAKQDITDASPQWEDVKKIRFRKFRLIDDVNKYAEKAIYMMGPIAQELEEAGMKGLVETPVDKDGNETDLQKTVKLSIMHMKGMKALQEAMARIEQLEARLAAANL